MVEKMVDEIKNKESLNDALETLKQLGSSHSTPKIIKKNISDLVNVLENEEDSIAMRAANAISMLDDISQDANIPSYVRVTLWQVVSKLEAIRE